MSTQDTTETGIMSIHTGIYTGLVAKPPPSPFGDHLVERLCAEDHYDVINAYSELKEITVKEFLAKSTKQPYSANHFYTVEPERDLIFLEAIARDLAVDSNRKLALGIRNVREHLEQAIYDLKSRQNADSIDYPTKNTAKLDSLRNANRLNAWETTRGFLQRRNTPFSIRVSKFQERGYTLYFSMRALDEHAGERLRDATLLRQYDITVDALYNGQRDQVALTIDRASDGTRVRGEEADIVQHALMHDKQAISLIQTLQYVKMVFFPKSTKFDDAESILKILRWYEEQVEKTKEPMAVLVESHKDPVKLLPKEAQRLAEIIRTTLSSTEFSERMISDEDYALRETLRSYLPDTINAFLNIPLDQRTQHHEEILIQQLQKIYDTVQAVLTTQRTDVEQNAEKAFEANGQFLSERLDDILRKTSQRQRGR
jgi:hypothetical protein